MIRRIIFLFIFLSLNSNLWANEDVRERLRHAQGQDIKLKQLHNQLKEKKEQQKRSLDKADKKKQELQENDEPNEEEANQENQVQPVDESKTKKLEAGEDLSNQLKTPRKFDSKEVGLKQNSLNKDKNKKYIFGIEKFGPKTLLNRKDVLKAKQYGPKPLLNKTNPGSE